LEQAVEADPVAVLRRSRRFGHVFHTTTILVNRHPCVSSRVRMLLECEGAGAVRPTGVRCGWTIERCGAARQGNSWAWDE
jgi:hypothetical protein